MKQRIERELQQQQQLNSGLPPVTPTASTTTTSGAVYDRVLPQPALYGESSLPIDLTPSDD